MESFFSGRSLLSFQAGNMPEYVYPALILVVLMGAVSLLIALILLRRRGSKRELQKILRGTEEFLRGNYGWRIEVQQGGRLAKVAANINQLIADFRERSSEVENVRDYFHNLVESAEDCALLSTNTDWDIVSFNTGAVRLLGWSKEQVVGKSLSIIFSEATWLNLLPVLARRESREQSILQRGEFRTRDDASFQGSASIHPIRSKSGAIAGFLVLVKDLSEQSRLEGEIEEFEEKYRSLAEGLTEAVFILQKGKIVFANSALAALLGSGPQELDGKFFKDFIATEDLLFVASALNEVENGPGKTVTLNLMTTDPSGKGLAECTLVASAISFRGEPAIIGAIRDITEIARAERRRVVHEGRLDSALDSVSDAIILFHELPSGSAVVLSNRSCQKLFGLQPESLLGVSVARVMAILSSLMKEGETFRRTMGEILAGKEVREALLFEMVKPEPRIVECVTSSVEEHEWGIRGRVFSFRDVTGQKEFEEKLKQNAEELRRSKEALEKAYRELHLIHEDLQKRAQELDRMNEELRTLDEMKTKLLGNVSHELQTPLVSIRGYTEMILKGKLGAITEEQEKGLKVSLKNIDRLIHMIDNLMNFSRLGKEEEELFLEEFPLWQVIDESAELVREKMEASDIAITTQYQTDDLTVKADRGKIAQIFINLLSNAIKFNRRGGNVSITVRKETPGFLTVLVKDTGIGIAPEHQERIFERFYRVESPRARSTEGAGIGLSIVKEILQKHRCGIAVQSKVSEGATFIFTLPLADVQARAKAPQKPEEKPEKSASRDLGNAGVVKIKIIRPPLKT